MTNSPSTIHSTDLKRWFSAAIGATIVIIAANAYATGDPSTSTLLGWSEDGRYFATFEDGESSYSGNDVPAVEVNEIKNGTSRLIFRIQEYCGDQNRFVCKTLRRKTETDHEHNHGRAVRRVGLKHRFLRKFKLKPVKKTWRSDYKALGLQIKKSGRRRFKQGRTKGWRIEKSDGSPLGYIFRGDNSGIGYTRVVGGYLKKDRNLLLLKLKKFNEGYRHQEHYLAIDITKSSKRSLN